MLMRNVYDDKYCNREILGNISTLGFQLLIFLWIYLNEGGHSEDFDVGGKKKTVKYPLEVVVKTLSKHWLYLYENSSICLQQKLAVWEEM